ncbi:MAG: cobalt-precorrin-5B (C(1))-methyltransferase CbiD [Desulfobacterales bacterium]
MKEKTAKRKLRTGFTTGTAAAAAAKGAVQAALGRQAPAHVDVRLLTGDTLRIAVHNCTVTDPSAAVCTVIKDAGDDPDATHGAEIGARIKFTGPGAGLHIKGGAGVGTVTRPGLETPPGSPAINPGPQKMIRQTVQQALDAHADPRGAEIEIFVPRGEIIAGRTLNARLGIVGGISILGTTGVVKPMSHEAYIATIASAMSVANASGTDTVVCTTGRRSERHAQALFADLPEPAFVQIGDYFEKSMQLAAKNGFSRIVLAAFFGKAVKMAAGAPHTHAAKSKMNLAELSRWVSDRCPDPDAANRVASANTAREAFFEIKDACPEVFAEVGARMTAAAHAFAGGGPRIRAVIFDYTGEVAFDTAEKGAFL